MHKKVGAGANHWFTYGPGGQLLGEHNGGWTHYARLPDGTPLAMIRGGQISYIHTDHLGRPEIVTNGSKAVTWRASNHDFDRTVTLDSIGGLNLGFPGQYHDTETGLAYNYFRTYNPRTGRYLESDQIGLQGGLNMYAYVSGNPVGFIDSLGLTQEDIDCMYALAKGLEKDLKFPRKAPLARDFGPPDENGFETHGMYDPLRRQIYVSDRYLKPLSSGELEELYDTLVHEVLHPNWGLRGAFAKGHQALAEEANRRTERANPAEKCGCGK